ncbi:hypothetical protein AgCh_013362 [Apium graveolens]
MLRSLSLIVVHKQTAASSSTNPARMGQHLCIAGSPSPTCTNPPRRSTHAPSFSKSTEHVSGPAPGFGVPGGQGVLGGLVVGGTTGGTIPGGRTGGTIPGGRTPGGRTPGGRTPGGRTGGTMPGGRTPGGSTPGGRTGGTMPGGRTPGGRTPGGRTPGGRTGGTIPGGRTGGTIPGGLTTGGFTTGGFTTGGLTTGGLTTGGLTTGGLTTGGLTTGGFTIGGLWTGGLTVGGLGEENQAKKRSSDLWGEAPYIDAGSLNWTWYSSLFQMADKKMTRLAKMNVARKSNEFPIRSRYTSLIDMINTCGDEYPSDAYLDAHDHISALWDPKELEKLSSCSKIKEPFKLVLAGPADRACQWKKDALCVYRDTLRAERFLFVIWEGGDWGTLFRSSFGLAVDGSPNDIIFSEEEARAFNLLTQDNGTSHSWDLIRETVLVERGLSPVPKKMAEKIEEATKPKDLEKTRMKCAEKVFKDPRLGDRFPEFLLQAMKPGEEGPSQVLRTKQRPGAYFQPAWGIRGKDSIVGSTALAKEWSKHSISPVDYQDFVLQQDLEGNELFGSQALATANAHFQGAIHQAKAWKVGLEDANKKLEEANQKIEALEAQIASSTSDLETAQAENVILKAQKDKAFDGWMDTQEFKDLTVEHDALLHPFSYKEGWDAAVEANQDEFPEVLEQSSFPSPVQVPELGGVTDKLVGLIKDGPSGSQGQKRKELESSSGEEEASSEEESELVTKKVRVEEPPRAVPQQPASPATSKAPEGNSDGTSTGTSEGTVTPPDPGSGIRVVTVFLSTISLYLINNK